MKKAILVMTYGTPEDYTFEGVAKFFTNIKKLSSHRRFSPSRNNT